VVPLSSPPSLAAGITVNTEAVVFDFVGGNHTIKSSGKLFKEVNPKGNVPCLVLEDGTVLAEGLAVHVWISEQAPAARLFGGKSGSNEYYKALEAFNFVATDIHAGSLTFFWSPLVAEKANEEYFTKKLGSKFAFITSTWLGKSVGVTGKVTSADLYLWWTLGAAMWKGLPIVDDQLKALYQTISDIPAVKTAVADMNAAFA